MSKPSMFVKLTAQPGKRDEVVAAFDRMLTAVADEPGTRGVLGPPRRRRRERGVDLRDVHRSRRAGRRTRPARPWPTCSPRSGRCWARRADPGGHHLARGQGSGSLTYLDHILEAHRAAAGGRSTSARPTGRPGRRPRTHSGLPRRARRRPRPTGWVSSPRSSVARRRRAIWPPTSTRPRWPAPTGPAAPRACRSSPMSSSSGPVPATWPRPAGVGTAGAAQGLHRVGPRRGRRPPAGGRRRAADRGRPRRRGAGRVRRPGPPARIWTSWWRSTTRPSWPGRWRSAPT